MEMGVNRGQPPGSVQAQGYQNLPNQDYMQAFGDDGSYYQSGQGTLYHPANQPAKMSPNQALAYRKHCPIGGYQTSPESAQYMANKKAFMGECVQPMGTYGLRQPTQHSNPMYPPNGISATQTLHISAGQQTGAFMARSMMPGHSPNQGQFPGHMVYQGQGQIQQQGMIWYEEQGTGMPVRFDGNHGNQQLPMMSPPPTQQPMMMSQQQQQQIRRHHMMMMPVNQNHMWVMSGQQARMQNYNNLEPSVSPMCPSSPGYQQFHHQYRSHGKSQHAMAVHVTVPSYDSSPSVQQSSPSIPYSQALEGYPNTGHRRIHVQMSTGESPNALQTGLPVSSLAHGTCVYTMANTQMLQGTMVSTGGSGSAVMVSSDQNTSTSTGCISSSDQRPTPGNSVAAASDKGLVTAVDTDQIKTQTNVSEACSVMEELADWHGSHDQSVASAEEQNSVEDASESKSITVDNHKEPALSSAGEETSDKICMQLSYSCGISKPEHSSTSAPHNTVQSTQLGTALSSNNNNKVTSSSSSSPMTASSVDGDGSETDDVSKVVVPFGWKRVVENGAVVYYSPSKTRLESETAITAYLMKEGTCKCGLSCPLQVNQTFNFDPEVHSMDWSADSLRHNDNLNNLCNHKRKMVAMATLQTTNLQTSVQFGDSQQAASKVLEALSLNKKDGTKKKKSKVKGANSMAPHDGMLVSQLLMQRDKLREHHAMNALQPNTLNSGMIPKCGNEPKMEGPSVVGQTSGSEGVQIPTDGRALQHMHTSEMAGIDDRYPHFPNSPMYRSHSNFDMLMSMHQKVGDDSGQMSFGKQKSACMPPVNQMFSLQLQMQAQAAAARSASASHRCAVMSPSLTSHSQQSSPSPRHHQMKIGTDVVSSTSSPLPPSYVSNSSPSTSTSMHLSTSTDTGSQSQVPVAKRKKKKKRKRDAFNKTMSSLLDKNMPCPNVDVRQFSENANPSAGLMQPSFGTFGMHGEKVASFMDNPAAFLAQQAEMVTSKLKSTLTEDVPFTKSVPGASSESKEDSLEHLLEAKPAQTACENQLKGYDGPKSPVSKDDSTQHEDSGIESHQEISSTLSSHSQGGSIHRDTSAVAVGAPAVGGHDPKVFPASCLLTAAARARVAQSVSASDDTVAMTTKPSSTWRFRIPSGPAPIQHVPPGGQHIGGGSIVYHHKIENQQAFHEGGIVNGGGIIMVTSPAHRGESLTLNCMPSVPLMLQGAMASKGIQLFGDLVQNMSTAVDGHAMVDVSDAAVIYNLLQCSMNEQLQAKLTAASSSKQQASNPITIGQNVGPSNDAGRDSVQQARPVLEEDNPVKSFPEGQINGLAFTQVSRKVAVAAVNMPMPPLPDSAITAVTDSITQVIPASGVQALGCVQSTETHITNNMVQVNMVIGTPGTVSEHNRDETSEKTEVSGCQDAEVKQDDLGKEEESKLPRLVNCNQQANSTKSGEKTNVKAVKRVAGLRTKLCLRIGRRKKKKRKRLRVTSLRSNVNITESGQASSESLDQQIEKEPQTETENESETVTASSVTSDPNPSVDAVQGQGQPVADDGAIMMTAYQNEGFTISQSELLDSSQIVLGHSQGLQQQFIQTQGQEVGPVCFSSPGQNASQVGSSQDQAGGIIQTVSFLPNMVGIDPNTGLVQSIHMPLPTGAESAKDQPAISHEHISPLAQSQVVHTVMQSLHIQNNVLVQGVTPGGMAGTFLQPLNAVGNTLIPVFQSPVAVGTDCEEGTLSMMSVTPVSQSTDLQPVYVESQKKSCNVVSTQTEAVQTEDSCSDLMDTEGGRLLVDYEDGILADDSYVLENGETDSSSMVYSSQGLDENAEEGATEISTDVVSSDTGQRHGSRSALSAAETQAMVPGIIEQSVPASDTKNVMSSGSKSAKNSQPVGGFKSGMHLQEKEVQKAGTLQKSRGHLAGHTQTSVTDEMLSCVHSDSSSSLQTQQVSCNEGSAQTDSASESITMPVLSREGSVLSDSVRVCDTDKIKPGSALEQIHSRLEEALRRYMDEADNLDHIPSNTSPSKQEREACVDLKEHDVAKPATTEVKAEQFDDPPNLPVMTRLGRGIRKRPFFQKGKSGHFKKKSRKVVRNGLCPMLPAHRHRNTVCKETANQHATDKDEPVIINNNKPSDLLIDSGSDVLPEQVAKQGGAKCPQASGKMSSNEVVSKQSKMPTTNSTGGSSDGEANQSSDSSQSMSTSEGDEVRCGNSPAIRCSNLLTSSPETSEINCSGLADLDKLENMYTEGSTNHVAPAGKQMKTRRSLRSELNNMLPNHSVKRSFSEKKNTEAGSVDNSSGSISPDPGYTRTLCPGELIWGPVKTYPSWPGKLVNYNDVPKNPKSEDGKLWVHWFGFHTYSQVEPQELKTLTEGLEAHHSARQKHRKGRKLNSSLEAAIQEAMLELDRQMEQDNQSTISTDINVDTKVTKVTTKKKKLR